MNTKEINENRNDHRVKFSKKSEILNANGIMLERITIIIKMSYVVVALLFAVLASIML